MFANFFLLLLNSAYLVGSEYRVDEFNLHLKLIKSYIHDGKHTQKKRLQMYKLHRCIYPLTMLSTCICVCMSMNNNNNIIIFLLM